MSIIPQVLAGIGGSFPGVLNPQGFYNYGRLWSESNHGLNFVKADNLYFTPHGGNVTTIYDGRRWKHYTFGEKILTGPVTPNTTHDVFIDPSLTLSLGADITAGRSTGDDLVYLDGIVVNDADPTKKYLGTIFADSNGQFGVTFEESCILNWYNRLSMVVSKFSSDSHTYTSGTIRPWNNDPTLSIRCMASGLQIESILVKASHITQYPGSLTSATIGIGDNDQTNFSALTNQSFLTADGIFTLGSILHFPIVGLGLNTFYVLESGATGYQSFAALISGSCVC